MSVMNGAMGTCAALATAFMLSHPAAAGWDVRISGSVIKPGHARAPVTIVVCNAGGDTIWQRTSKAKHFQVNLSGDQLYRIGFSQPGCVPKEVLIDPRNEQWEAASKNVLKVEFTVVLEPDPNAELQYAGPVGRIGFAKRSGRLLVDHHYVLEKRREEPAKQ